MKKISTNCHKLPAGKGHGVGLFAVLLMLAQAGAGEVLDWKTCVKEAIRRNPELVSAREAVRQAEANKIAARSGRLPQISGSAKGSRSKRESQDEADSYSYGLSARQLLFDGGKKRYETAQAEERITSSRFKYEIASSNVRSRLRTAFVGLLRAQKLVRLTEDIRKRREQSTRLIKLRYEAGREHRGSLLTAEARQVQAEFESAQARRSVELAQRKLAEVLGRSVSNSVSLMAEGGLDVGVIETSKLDFAKLAESTPFLKELISQTRTAGLGMKSARANLLPSVNANAGTGRSASDWPPDESDWSVGVSISVPIFEGGQRVAKVLGAESVLRRAEADEESGKNSVAATLHSNWSELQDATERVGVRQKFLEAASARARISEAQYTTGLLSFDNWIIIEDSFVGAEKALLDAQANAMMAESGWMHAKGGTLENEIGD